METHQKSGTTTSEASASRQSIHTQRADQDQQAHERADALAGLRHHEPLDRGHVGGQPGEGVAEAATVVGRCRQRQHVGEDVAAQVDEEPLRDVGRQVVVGARDDAAGEVEADVEEREREQRLEGRRDEHVVDQPLVEERLGDRDRRCCREEQQAEQQPATQRPQPRPEPAGDVGRPEPGRDVDEGLLLGGGAQQAGSAAAYGHGSSCVRGGGRTSGTGGRPGVGPPTRRGGAAGVAQLERERDRLRLRRRRRRRRRPSSLDESPRRAWTAGVRAVRIPERAMVASFGCDVRVFPADVEDSPVRT